MEFLPSALAQAGGSGQNANQNPTGMQFFKFKLGDIEVTQVFDGENVRKLADDFVLNAPVDGVKKALVAGGLSGENIPISYTVTIIRAGGRTIMFDAGTAAAAQPAAGRLQTNMKAAGIDPASINTIIVTHFHGDHIFGLMDKDNAQVYPNAEIIMPAQEYNFWTDAAKTASLPAARQGLAKRVQAVFPGWKNIRRAEAGSDVAPGVRSVATFGHSPGHTSYLISSGSAQYMVAADVTNIHQLFVRNPGWVAVFDQDAAMAAETRLKLFDQAVADKMLIGGYHWGMPGCGTLAKDGNGYVFSPKA